MLTGGWKDFRTALVATGLTLGCFIIWHTIRLPWLIHKRTHDGDPESEPGTWAGILGVIVVAGVFIGGYEFSLQIWNSRPLGEIAATLKSDPGAKTAEIAQLRQQISDLIAKEKIAHLQHPTPLAPLRCRVEGLSREIYAFNSEWNGATCGMYICGPNPDTDRQTQIMKNEQKIEDKQFRRDYLPRAEALSRELKKQGLNTELLDSRLQVSAPFEYIASELSVLGSQLPQVDCAVSIPPQ